MQFSIVLSLAFMAIAAEARKINFCYYGNWGAWGAFKPSQIRAEYCTHIGYSFIGLRTDGTCFIRDPALEESGGLNAIGQTVDVGKKTGTTKVCPVVGGAGLSFGFASTASNPTFRNNFVNSITALIQKYGFSNCLDIDWEFPQNTAERDGLIELLKAVKAKDPSIELFVAVSAGIEQADISYNVAQMAKYVDFINLMTYDYHGSWEAQTGMNGPLYGPAGDQLNIAATVNYYARKGALLNKLLIGIPFYGRTFRLTTAANGVGAPSADGSTLNYGDICSDIGWNIQRDNLRKVPYAVKGSQWLSFDDQQSIAEKTQFVKQKGLGGTIIWAVNHDDCSNACLQGHCPLLAAVSRGLI